MAGGSRHNGHTMSRLSPLPCSLSAVNELPCLCRGRSTAVRTKNEATGSTSKNERYTYNHLQLTAIKNAYFEYHINHTML